MVNERPVDVHALAQSRSEALTDTKALDTLHDIALQSHQEEFEPRYLPGGTDLVATGCTAQKPKFARSLPPAQHTIDIQPVPKRDKTEVTGLKSRHVLTAQEILRGRSIKRGRCQCQPLTEALEMWVEGSRHQSDGLSNRYT